MTLEGGVFTDKNPALKEILDWALHIIIAVAIGLLIVTFIAQITVVNGISMVPTLQDSDRLLIEKISPRLNKLGRGDIVTVNVPEYLDAGKETIIKRVIAVENDTVEVRDGRVYVNGDAIQEPYTNGETNPVEPEFTKLTVPAGHIYVMGDNRANSKDSRTFGPVSLKKVGGKVVVRILPLNKMGMIK